MLQLLLTPLQKQVSWFRIFNYTSFRLVAAAITALLLAYFFGPRFIRFLRRLRFGESVRNDGPESHQSKAGTPTMGGMLIMASMSISILLWGNLSNLYVMLVWLGTLALSAVGFIDDYSKSVLKISGGMKARTKFFWQIVIALGFAILVYMFPYTAKGAPEQATNLYLPFMKNPLFNMGVFAVLFWMFVVVGTSNAVNLTDGLDGLAAGISVVVIVTLALIAYITGLDEITRYLLLVHVPEANEVSVFLAALAGACVGFLWFNAHPAEVFMGDTGSLAIGGSIGMTAILIHREILLMILGGIFVAEALSVILQVGSYKLRQKRIFRMAPLHHHFELGGWHENKVVIRFWIVGILLALISVSSLKIL
ncbi:phospho-N-acetylmuramoyl-pentapeptide-transferase [Turneriella parva]|uniref:Phospho-N-acetylmuramoyl-pentapeptide-transferase n=1 Tax=Turneriella parva (strain ATCC BAA-1111 / DSM 21527 / NCTC 11395 / H) TaxID=869212 RepID=I4B0E9_TURPD|nr:phospho-N-acetylmuramoyl-pentapeptide-transferase [Turneriella parva]AFM10756.1 Phospho-N-acetylmuramoyl-pentapeptide-transferase [Turneriella parva DSM 21527]